MLTISGTASGALGDAATLRVSYSSAQLPNAELTELSSTAYIASFGSGFE